MWSESWSRVELGGEVEVEVVVGGGWGATDHRDTPGEDFLIKDPA